MELVTHVIGNYSIQDLCYAGQMLRKAATTHSREVGSLGLPLQAPKLACRLYQVTCILDSQSEVLLDGYDTPPSA